MQVKTLTSTGKTGSAQVSDTLFNVEVNKVLLSQAIRVYLSNQRQGTSKVKTRSEVNRTKKKWFKQKGTGNARHGARTPNIFVGGGVSHGPNGEQNWTKSFSRQMKQQALVHALSAQAAANQVVVANDIASLKGQTKAAATLLAPILAEDGRILVILPAFNAVLLRSLRNIAQVLVVTADRVNALEVSMADTIILTTEAVDVLEKRMTAEKVATPKAAKTKIASAEASVKAEKSDKPVKPAAKKAAPKKAATSAAAPKAKAAKTETKPKTKKTTSKASK